MRVVVGILGVIGVAAIAAAAGFPAPGRPVAGIISPIFSDEATRDRHREAERVMDALEIKPGVRVADIGAGTGYYTARVARRLGVGAEVYAEDIKPEYLEQLRARLEREAIRGVKLVLGRAGDPMLPRDSIDVAILSHVYHEIENPFEFLFHLHPALAPGARVGVVDVDRPTQEHGTPPALLRCEMAAVGYRQIGFVSLAPAEGYLATYVAPARLPAVDAIKPCPQ